MLRKQFVTNVMEFSRRLRINSKKICARINPLRRAFKIPAHFHLRALQCGTLQVRLPRWSQMESWCLHKHMTGSKTQFRWMARFGDISDPFEDTVRSNVDKHPEADMQVLFQGCSSHVLQMCWQGGDRAYD